MADLTDRIMNLKKKVQDAEKEEDQITGRLEAEKDQLLKEHRCKTVTSADKKLEQLEKDLETEQEQLEKDLEELEKEI